MIGFLVSVHKNGNAENSLPINNTPPGNINSLIPVPLSLQIDTGYFSLSASTPIYVDPGTKEALTFGVYLEQKLMPATGFYLNVSTLPIQPTAHCIILTKTGADSSLGEEGYTLIIKSDRVTITALNSTGIFYGIQTLRQLLPALIESSAHQSGPWEIPDLTIRDKPRFAWRGLMIDVARHFFAVKDIKHIIDEMAYYKLNRLHLHLTDDQGWRIAINSWPDLTSIGGSTQTIGGSGGYYSQEQYADIVEYAQSRNIMIVPEIDMPGHTNAALASYSDLNEDSKARLPYTGMDVGFSSLAINKEISYAFVDSVVRELTSITPGPFIHLGGDEAHTLSDSDYVKFIQRVQSIVQSYHKQLIGWEEIAKATLLPSSIIQLWNTGVKQSAIEHGAKIIMSPASKTYLDMKYNSQTSLGQDWAGFITVKDAYDWDPAKLFDTLPEKSILGIEAPLWTETITSISEIEFMIFPRLPGIAEIGWSPQEDRHWDEYSERLAEQGQRLTLMGINFYKSNQVNWK